MDHFTSESLYERTIIQIDNFTNELFIGNLPIHGHFPIIALKSSMADKVGSDIIHVYKFMIQ